MEADRRFDDVLMTMAGQLGSIEHLLLTFFSFLHRNTDFYVAFDPARVQKAKMGFPNGQAEQVLLRAFNRFPFRPYGDQPDPRPAGGRGKPSSKNAPAKPSKPPAQIQSKAPPTGAAPPTPAEAKEIAKADVSGSLPPRMAAAAAVHSEQCPAPPVETMAASVPAAPATAAAAAAAGRKQSQAAATPPARPVPRVQYTDDGKQVPVGNGGVTDRYCWTQTLYEATVYIAVPPGTRGRDVDCEIGARTLRVAVPGGSGGGAKVLLKGRFPEAVSRDGSMWTLDSGETVVVSLEKARRNWWRSAVEGDEEIDTTRVDSTCTIDEYDAETQGAIRKIMFDQKQKALGLPTSEQLTTDSILEGAKHLPGSPFLPGGPMAGGAGPVEDELPPSAQPPPPEPATAPP